MTYTDDLEDLPGPAAPRPSGPHRRRHVVPAGDVETEGLSALQVVDEDPELHMLKCDLAAFQREEMDALGTCITALLTRAPRVEALRAWTAHEAARLRTRECLRRLHAW
ncbi:hypothetical protein HK414_23635 [Ramlibacter terrae]|uniref:Uncharacterized protein n=1 Tax=Ramlibacter terrae TaxID=2732511 RepID=A0ABX6P7G8_9BURK|nr:hypothetical protein HK414_23635 [Ramlibacter terrae]